MDNQQANENTMREMTSSDFTDKKADMSTQLNASMSIDNQAPDEYTNRIRNIGGNN
jgi:hypothetical protein